MPLTLSRLATRFALLLLPFTASLGVAAEREARVLHFETVDIDFKSAEVATAQRSGALAKSMRFTAFGKNYVAGLEPNARLNELASHATAYRGTLSGRANSWVRVTRTGDEVHGLIYDGTELYAIEPAETIDAQAQGVAIFRLADTRTDLGPNFCDTSETAPKTGLDVYNGLSGDAKNVATQLQSVGARLRLEMSALMDTAYRSRFASDAAAADAIVARVNNVDGIFTGQVGVSVAVTQIVQTNLNSGIAITNADSLLQSVSRLRNTTPNLYAAGITHLFTGVDLDGSTVGISYIDTVCSQQYSASLSEVRDRGAWFDSLVAAHELGHSFGSPHDGAGQCAAAPTNLLMAPTISGSDQFSQCSLGIIKQRVQSASCLLPVAVADISLPADLGTIQATLNQSFTWSFAVSNIGSVDSPGSQVLITVPAALKVIAAKIDGGVCSVGGGAVACDLGTLIARDTRTVELTLLGSQSGSFSINAQAGATVDADTSNDSGNALVSIDPSADMAVSMSAPDSGNANQSFGASITVANLSDVTIANVSVDIILPSGITLSGAAQLDGIACQQQFQTIHCTLAAMSGGRTVNTALTLVPHDSGTQIITASLTGAYIDPHPQDNTAQKSILIAGASVTATASTATPSESSGGGAFGAELLLALALLTLGRRRLRTSFQA